MTIADLSRHMAALAAEEPGAAERCLAELDRPPPGTDPDDPEAGVFFLLRMAARCRRRRDAPLPPLDETRLAALTEALAERPGADEDYGQLHIAPASTLRRADALRRLAAGAPILSVGDDDGVTLALALDGAEDVWAVDIDDRILAFLAGHGVRAETVDVLGSPVPAALRGRFGAVVTDPFRDLDGGLGFLSFAAACLRKDPAGYLGWVDHPDWNFEHGAVLEAMGTLGFELLEIQEDLHAYPVPMSVADPEGLARALGLDPAPLLALARGLEAWSHLLILRRAR